VNGYVVSAAKRTAAVILSSHLDDPILSAWRAGLGRVAVFTADLASPWSAPLRAWRDDGRLWAQTIRWLGRGQSNRAIQLAVRDAERGPRLEADFTAGERADAEPDEVAAIVREPGGATSEVDLEAVAPGRYAAPFPAAETGPYNVTLTARDRRRGTEAHFVRAVYWSAEREHQAHGADVQFLSRLASLTGGRFLRDNESPFHGPGPWGGGVSASDVPHRYRNRIRHQQENVRAAASTRRWTQPRGRLTLWAIVRRPTRNSWRT